jgi:RNA polymerase sigma-70 factor (ECF subfamily)
VKEKPPTGVSRELGSGSSAGKDLESTAELLGRVRGGDTAARERLVAQYLPMLKRWAHGRLPSSARGMVETDDLVQVSLIRALDHVGEFEPRREGAFLAYLRRILLNALRDEIRRSARRPAEERLPDDLTDQRPSLLEQTIGREAVESYETALASLPEAQQEAVILRIEFGFDYQQIAEAVGSPSSKAAHMMVSRALLRLAKAIEEHWK